MTSKLRIVGLSDVSVGYGSPEVPALLHDLCQRYEADGWLIEPDEADRPPIPLPFAFDIIRVHSSLPPQSASWRRHFLTEAIRKIDAIDPDILVVFGAAVFSALPALKRRPRRVIYHAYEQIAERTGLTIRAHQLHLADVDLTITPAIRRLIHDCTQLGVWPARIVEIRNAGDVVYPDPIARRAPTERTETFFWCGALSRERTFADWFFDADMPPFAVEAYGRVHDDARGTIQDGIDRAEHFNHHGIVSAQALNDARARSAFSLLWWNPKPSFGHLHLASNRFFTSIQAGVPPICGPHPQCVEIADQFDCAIIMKDWTLAALIEAMEQARDIYEDQAAYAELVQRCWNTAETLSWPQQFDLIAQEVDALLVEDGFATDPVTTASSA